MVIFDFYDDFLNVKDQNLNAHLILFQILNQGIEYLPDVLFFKKDLSQE